MNRFLAIGANALGSIGALQKLWALHGVPPHHAIPDYLRFRRLIDCASYDFFTSHIWDRRLPEVERLRYLSQRDRLRIELRMNPRADQQVLRDKSAVAAMLGGAGIPGADVLAIALPASPATSRDPGIHDLGGLQTLLARGHPDGLACKPVFGMAGHDVLVFPEVTASTLTHADGTRWSAARLWQTMVRPTRLARDQGIAIPWQVERRTPPHPALAALHGDVLGCVRVVTLRFDDGEIGFLDPTWKIPVGRAGVDNLSYGSLTAAVDLDTGTVGRPILQRTMVRHDHHPHTGARLTGVILPDWPRALELAREAMALFPALRSLGFDVGLTTSGPRIIEVNPYWGIQMMQAPHGRGVIRGAFLRFLEELGAEDVLRRRARGL